MSEIIQKIIAIIIITIPAYILLKETKGSGMGLIGGVLCWMILLFLLGIIGLGILLLF